MKKDGFVIRPLFSDFLHSVSILSCQRDNRLFSGLVLHEVCYCTFTYLLSNFFSHILLFKLDMTGSVEPVFQFLTGPAVLCKWPVQGLAEKNTGAKRGWFFSSQPARQGRLAQSVAKGDICCKKWNNGYKNIIISLLDIIVLYTCIIIVFVAGRFYFLYFLWYLCF